MGFRILEHPADVGIEATGRTMGEAFEQAARGLFSLIADQDGVDTVEQKKIQIEAADVQHVLVRWLSELLYLYDGEGFLLKKVRVQSVTPTKIVALLFGEKYSPKKHRLKLDVKAITYHQLSIKEDGDMTTIRVYLDI